MSLKKFADRRREIQKKLEDEIARINEEEAREREKRIAPLASRFATLFQDVMGKALSDRVDDLEAPRFRKASVRARLEQVARAEIEALLASSDDPETFEPSDEAPEVSAKGRKAKTTPPTTPQTEPGMFEKGIEDDAVAGQL